MCAVSSRMQLRSWRALLYAALLSLSCWTVSAQSLAPNSDLPEPLWTTLLLLTDNLPTQIDNYEASWTLQIVSLQNNVEQLQTSNDSLTQQNTDLQTSLLRSRADLAISEQAQEQLQKSLDDSIASTTRAQQAAVAVEAENRLLRYGMIGAVAVTVAAVVIAAVK